MFKYPDAVDPEKVGTYPALVKSGGAYVWDEVLEFRVWCHPERGAPDLVEGERRTGRYPRPNYTGVR